MKRQLTMRAMLAAVLVMCFGIMAYAEHVPGITMYYPGKRDEAPLVLAPNTKAYTYFETGSLVVENKARVIQNGEAIGTCVYKGAAQGKSTTTMDPKDAENEIMNNIPAGLFTLEIYEVTYLEGGVSYTYSDIDNPIGSVTYERKPSNGKVVSETGFEDHVIKSYYPAGGDDGVKIYTFDRAVNAANIHAYFEYGYGDNRYLIAIPWSLSRDGLRLTIDLRGTCYNPDYLAPGVTFYDEFGNPTTPPTTISIVVDNLDCVDGTKIEYESMSLDGEYSATLQGRIFENFEYLDLTFPNPVLDGIEFYAKSAPSVIYSSINADTDMFALKVLNNEYISKADIKLASGTVEAIVPWAMVEVVDDKFVSQIPDQIKAIGSEQLIISLINVEYTADDGSTHVIKPLNLANSAIEVRNLGALKAVEAGSKVVINVPDGITITLSNDYGYTFAEDATGAIQLVTEDYSKAFEQARLIKGRIEGTYLGYGMFMVDKASSVYTEQGADVWVGAMPATLDELYSGAYDSRLVTLVASKTMTMEYDKDLEAVMIADQLPALLSFIENFEDPGEVLNITGVFFNDVNIGQSYLLVRGNYDINQELDIEKTVGSIAELKTVTDGETVIVEAFEAKVTYANDDYGFAILEDVTGAIPVYTDDYVVFEQQGVMLSGMLYGVYEMGVFVIDQEQSSYDKAEVDVTTGAEITVEEASDPANQWRLVTFNNSESTPIVQDGFGLMIGNAVAGVDYFDVLPYDYEFPASISSFTGILVPQLEMIDDAQTTMPALVAFRSASDIKERLTSITDIAVDGVSASNVYDMRGVKVRNAGESLSNLPKGLYIINSQKVIKK